MIDKINSQYQSVPVSTSHYQSVPVSTSHYQSVPVITSQYRSAVVSTSQYQSLSVSASQCQSVILSVSCNWTMIFSNNLRQSVDWAAVAHQPMSTFHRLPCDCFSMIEFPLQRTGERLTALILSIYRTLCCSTPTTPTLAAWQNASSRTWSLNVNAQKRIYQVGVHWLQLISSLLNIEEQREFIELKLKLST